MKPKLSFIMPAQIRADRNDGIAYGRIISDAVVPAAAHPHVVEDDREEQAEEERRRHRDDREREGPERHVDERCASRWSVTARTKLSNPTVICQPGSSSSPSSEVKAPVPMSE